MHRPNFFYVGVSYITRSYIFTAVLAKMKCQVINLLKDCNAFIFRVKQFWTLTLNMNALQSLETLVTLFQLTLHNILEDFNLCCYILFVTQILNVSAVLSVSILHMRTVLTLLELCLLCSYSFDLFGGLLPQFSKLCEIVFSTFFTCRRSTNTFSFTNRTAIYKCLFQTRNDHLLGGSLPY